MNYQGYLETAHWEETKKKILKRDKYKCIRCGKHKNLNVHHLSYANLGAEKDEDLITFCSYCHYRMHRIEKEKQSR